jgi:hypothetical protein
MSEERRNDDGKEDPLNSVWVKGLGRDLIVAVNGIVLKAD